MSESPHTAAFIDLGTNSIRLMLVRVHPDQSYEVLSQQKETARLGEGEFIEGRLQPEAMDRAALICKKFVEMARAHEASELIAVATAAVREAENQAEFARRLQEEADIDLRIISGREEARLIYLGVVSGLNIGNAKSLFIDIGGGSTEIIVGDQHNYDWLDTLKLGSIRLSNLFLLGEQGAISTARYEQMKTFARNAAIRAIQKSEQFPVRMAFGSSGTVMNLAQIAALDKSQKKSGNREELSFARLKQTARMLCRLTLEERRRVPGINPERADIIVGGAAILETLMEAFQIRSLRVSERGLREGLLVEYLDRLRAEQGGEANSLRTASVLRLGRLCRFDEAHARHVAFLATELFDSARDIGLHSLNQRARELLYNSALLHDVGMFLSYTDHQRHSYYFIRNSDMLGFDQKEIATMAALAFYHRKQFPRRKHPEFAELDPESQEIVRVNCVFLRIAEALDRSHTGVVQSARLRAWDEDSVALEIKAVRDPQLEIWGARNYEKSFERAFGKRLTLTLAAEK